MDNNDTSLIAEFSNPILIQEYQTDDGIIRVFENDDYRWIQSADNSIQSAMNKAQPGSPVLPYFPALLSSLLFVPAPQQVLVIGLGGGELVRFLNAHYADTRVHAVEKSTPMSVVFSEHFQQANTHYELVMGDICDYCINDKDRLYDLVFVDVYAQSGLPECFYKRRLFTYLSTLLAANGVAAINLIVNDEREAIEILQFIRQAFDRRTLCLSVGKHMNIVVLAFTQTPQIFSMTQLRKTATQLSHRLDVDYQALVENIINTNPNDGISLSFY